MKKRLIKYISLFVVSFVCVLTIGLCCIKKTSALSINDFPFDTDNSIGYSKNFDYQNIDGLTYNFPSSTNNNHKEFLELENGFYCSINRTSSSVSTSGDVSAGSIILPKYSSINEIYCIVIYMTSYVPLSSYNNVSLNYTIRNAGDTYNKTNVIEYNQSLSYNILDKPLFCYFNYFSQESLNSDYTPSRSITFAINHYDSVEFNAYIYKLAPKETSYDPIIDSVGNIIYNNKIYYNTENYLQYGADKYNEGLETRQDVNIKDYLLNSTFSTTFYSSNVHSPDNVIGYSITTITDNDFINDKLQIYDIWVRNAIDSFGTNWLDTEQYYYYDNEILFDKVLDNNAISVVFVGNSSVYDNGPYIKYTDNSIKVLTTDNLNSIYVFFTENENLKYINTLGWSGYGEDYTGQYIYISIGGELYGLGYNEGLIEGNVSGYNNGYGDGYEIGYNNGANDGYENGINASAGNTWSSIWDFIYNIFVFIGKFMDIEILPNIKIGYIVGIAIVFALFGFIINISK